MHLVPNDDDRRRLHEYDFADNRDIEIFSTRRRVVAGVVAAIFLTALLVVLLGGLWLVRQWMWGYPS